MGGGAAEPQTPLTGVGADLDAVQVGEALPLFCPLQVHEVELPCAGKAVLLGFPFPELH